MVRWTSIAWYKWPMLLDDIGAYLQGVGLVSTGWTLSLGDIPDTPDQVISVFETGGWPFDTMNREQDKVSFQLRVRGARNDYTTPRAKWQACFDALQDADQYNQPVYLGGYFIIQSMHSGPEPPQFDTEGRKNFIANFKVYKTRQS